MFSLINLGTLTRSMTGNFPPMQLIYGEETDVSFQNGLFQFISPILKTTGQTKAP